MQPLAIARNYDKYSITFLKTYSQNGEWINWAFMSGHNSIANAYAYIQKTLSMGNMKSNLITVQAVSC